MSAETWIAIAVVLAGQFAAEPVFAQDDLLAAKRRYVNECGNCHGKITPDAIGAVDQPGDLLALVFKPPQGPELKAMFGRPAASVAGFKYTEPFLKATNGLVWDEATLDRLLSDSQAFAPGSTMTYRQNNPGVRRQIIAYLAANR